MNVSVESLIRNGATVEDITKAAVEAQKKITKEKEEKAAADAKEKEKLAKVAKARTQLVKAYEAYVTILTGEKPTDKEMNAFKRNLDSKEKIEKEDYELNEVLKEFGKLLFY